MVTKEHYNSWQWSSDMTIHDISLPISGAIIVWPSDPGVKITQTSHLDKGDVMTV